MTDSVTEQQPDDNTTDQNLEQSTEQGAYFFKIQFRPGDQPTTVSSRMSNLRKDEPIMVQTDHGLEPALVLSSLRELLGSHELIRKNVMAIIRRCTRDEVAKYEKLEEMEKSAVIVCTQQIDKLQLPMRLVRVERFFNGSKIIFFFTAENRVDFRELVKTLVQEFRTRVEMRQIGVRHETKMLGGIGCCGRELCCASFIKNFESVSIKMAKEQNLPLNPLKISGACNRLLCCLNYEFSTYKSIRKGMPKIGKRIMVNDRPCKVIRHNVLDESIVVLDEHEEITLNKPEWQKTKAEPIKK